MSDTTTTTTEQTRTETETTDVLAGLTDAQRKEIDRRAANARRDGEQTAATKLKADADKAKADEDAKREVDEATKRGEFDTVRTGLERERDTHKADADALKAERDRAIEVLSKQIEGRRDALPDEVKATFPTDAAPLAQIEWLDSPAIQGWVKALGAQTDAHRDALRGAAGVIPASRGDMTDAQRVAQERQHLVASGRVPKF
ncbi:hypothetical protein [Nocardioides sp.]|uniref:hypothetical protein n=1 Tax=Nocardioides sp. TaxID=35761 RepID=UPI002CC9582B|nr:hypothetical protein [Nocardioides sp.]HXH79527.1 hypothetical protein [Nocardioides sp.]